MVAFFSVNVTYKKNDRIQIQIIFEKTFFATLSLNLKIYPRNDDAGDVGRKLDQTGKEK